MSVLRVRTDARTSQTKVMPRYPSGSRCVVRESLIAPWSVTLVRGRIRLGPRRLRARSDRDEWRDRRHGRATTMPVVHARSDARPRSATGAVGAVPHRAALPIGPGHRSRELTQLCFALAVSTARRGGSRDRLAQLPEALPRAHDRVRYTRRSNDVVWPRRRSAARVVRATSSKAASRVA